MFAGIDLARRLERAEGLASASFAEARSRARPDAGSCSIEIAGVRCIFDGPDSPATQTFGLGLSEVVTSDAMDAIEAFFAKRDAPVFQEVSPLADSSALKALNEREYRPFEFTTVLFHTLAPDSFLPSVSCPVRVAKPEEFDHWSEVSARGWEHPPELGLFMADLAEVSRRRQDTVNFYADVQGIPAATGSLTVHGDIALLAGACTVPEFRGQGAQQSLLATRLRYAAERGCSLAVMGALPGSGSQRNAERNGFRVAYTRLKWKK